MSNFQNFVYNVQWGLCKIEIGTCTVWLSFMWYNFSNCRIGKNKKTEESAPVVEEDKDSLKEAELQFKVREEAVRTHQRGQER